MIEKDFKIDFKNKKISFKGKDKEYTAPDLYSFLMDTFDESENMKYDIPIEATGKDKFALINGWTIDEKAKKHLKGELGSSD